MFTIRKALPEDQEWINASYELINFQPSDFANELVIIGICNGDYAGVGRLIPIDEQSAELGGIYVPDGYRGKGIARQLVNRLLQETEGRQIFCIPFEHLVPFYLSCGFEKILSDKQLPCSLQKKLNWCKNTYESGTSVLRYSIS